MAKRNNIIEEIQELMQQIKNEYQEGVDFEFVVEKEGEKQGTNWMNILSPRLKKYCRERFNFPFIFNDYLDYQKGYKGGKCFTYRTNKDTSKYGDHDLILSLKEKEENTSQEKPENCAVCNKLAFKENGWMKLWDGEKDIGGPFPNVIGYFHPECAKKYFAGKEQPKENNTQIKEKILRNLDKISIEACGYLVNSELVKNYEEVEWYFRKGIFGDDNNPKWKAWWDKVQKVEIEGEEIDLEQLSSEDFWKINQALINEIKQNPSEWKIEEKKHTHFCEKMVRHQKSGRCHWKSLSNLKEWAEIEALVTSSSLPVNSQKTGDIEELNKLKIIFQKLNIKKITFKNGELIITHNNNNNNNETITNNQLTNNSEYQVLKNYCQENNQEVITSKSLGISADNTSTNINNPKPNHQLTIGLAVGVIGGVALTGVIIFLLSRKRKNK